MAKKLISKKLLKIDKRLFEDACIAVSNEEWYSKEDYLHIKNDKIQTHYLRIHLQKIAVNYFPSAGDKNLAFPSIVVRRIATKMDLYVTDIIRT